MGINPHTDQRFASFVLDRHKAIELAINAERVLEATPLQGEIQTLPSSVPYLEGLMRLRDDTIPVINMKKRLGLAQTDYGGDAKVAVVGVSDYRFGLLFDDIRDVLLVPAECIHAIHPSLLTETSLISDLIKLDNGRRTLERLDLQRLFYDPHMGAHIPDGRQNPPATGPILEKTYSRYVVFKSNGQEYGVPVDQTQEITFLTAIDDDFKNDSTEGTLQLRGDSLPVLSAARLFQHPAAMDATGADTRVLILNADNFRYGLIVDHIREIICVDNTAILAVPQRGHDAVCGIHQRPEGGDIMLIQVNALIRGKQHELKSMARIKSGDSNGQQDSNRHLSQCRHLVNTDCYLIFSIGRNFAIALNDVQEIIEPTVLMDLPAATGCDRRVLNLRGTLVPVINLRQFFNYEDGDAAGNKKLIIARNPAGIIAIEVDRIITIHKQARYRQTPSLNPHLNNKRDTLDRLIEYPGNEGVTEHVLVLNINALINNHLGMIATENINSNDGMTKENTNGSSD